MTSKNSFLVSMKENNKRRVWLWAISGLFWFFYYPVAMAMLMSRKHEHNRIDGLTGAAAKLRLTEAAESWLGVGRDMTAIVLAVIAVICAIQGFSYLYSRKKVDMYHSVPVKKSRRFAVIYINGVLVWFIPYLIGLLLAALIAGIAGGMNGANWKLVMATVPMHLILYLGVYGLSVLAVMMTGKLIITLFAVMIFLCYEIMAKGLLASLMERCFSYYCFYSEDGTLYLSPISKYLEAALLVQDSRGTIGAAVWSAMPMLLAGIAMAAAFTGISYYCYLKRPAEAAGKTMAFERTKAVVKFLIAVPTAIGVGLAVDSIVVSEIGFVIFGMAVAVILTNAVIEVIYEADIRAAFRKKYQILTSGACVAVISCVFYFDLLGYDAWVPAPEKLEDAVLLFYEGRSGTFVDSDIEYTGGVGYAMGKPGVTDVEAVCELSGRKADHSGPAIWLDVAYRMKSGKVVWRSFPVSVTEEELLDRIIGSDAYKNTAYQFYDDEEYAYIREREVKEITFDNGFRVDNLSRDDMDKIRELWKKDMEALDYTSLKDEFPCGEINFALITDKGYIVNFTYDIYPSFANVCSYLKEEGLDTDVFLKAEDIANITVTNNHNKERQQLYRDRPAMAQNGEMAYVEDEELSVTKTFSEEGEIKELLAAMYPASLNTRWKVEGTMSEDYYVTVYYKNGVVDNALYRGTPTARLIADRVPDWLEKATAYK